jgi:NADH:quinone reductase (non-electrogenic)
MEEQPQRRVVIIGGGFAGLFAARALRRVPVRVTVIDRAEHHLFQPLLYQCATGILSEGKIAAPLREVLKRHENVECVLAEVTGIDPAQRTVQARRPLGQSLEFGYDYLIAAPGVRQSYFGHDEFAAVAPGMKTIADALTIRRRVFGAFEMAESAVNHAESLRWLTFALVGAGPTGVELAGQIRELATKTLSAEYRRIRPQDARVLLLDGGSAPLASFGPVLSGKAAGALRRLGVELHMHSIVTKVDLDGVEVRGQDGALTRYPAGTVLWTAGVEAPPVCAAIAGATGASRDRAGRILVGPDLAIPGHPEIMVAGDAMSLDGLPGVAEVAMQAGLYAARRIRREVAGQPRPGGFRYTDLGSAAYISRGSAVVSAGRLQVGGFAGWWMWLLIHIGFMTGFRNRFGAVLSWWFAFTRDLRRERTFTSHEVGVLRDVYAPGPAGAGGTGGASGACGAAGPPAPPRAAGGAGEAGAQRRPA